MIYVAPDDITIQPRYPKYDLNSKLPKAWNDCNLVKSTFLSAFSVILPCYEQLFVEVMRRHMRSIADKNLCMKVEAFCAQEASHAAEHRTYNRHLVRQGYTAIAIANKIQKSLFLLVKNLSSDSLLLALCTAGEHITAMMGHEYLAYPLKWRHLCDPTMDSLWAWHAAEEIEHKAVCFDVYQTLCGNYWLRCLALVMTNIPSFFVIVGLHFYMFAVDGIFFKCQTWRDYARIMLGREGFLARIAKEYYKYFDPNFHPWQYDDSNLIRNLTHSSDFHKNSLKVCKTARTQEAAAHSRVPV